MNTGSPRNENASECTSDNKPTIHELFRKLEIVRARFGNVKIRFFMSRHKQSSLSGSMRLETLQNRPHEAREIAILRWPRPESAFLAGTYVEPKPVDDEEEETPSQVIQNRVFTVNSGSKPDAKPVTINSNELGKRTDFENMSEAELMTYELGCCLAGNEAPFELRAEMRKRGYAGYEEKGAQPCHA